MKCDDYIVAAAADDDDDDDKLKRARVDFLFSGPREPPPNFELGTKPHARQNKHTVHQIQVCAEFVSGQLMVLFVCCYQQRVDSGCCL